MIDNKPTTATEAGAYEPVGEGASSRAAETARPSDMAGGDAGRPSGPDASDGKYAGEPGPAAFRGENHMDPLREDKDAGQAG